jgi:hypothetical protein
LSESTFHIPAIVYKNHHRSSSQGRQTLPSICKMRLSKACEAELLLVRRLKVVFTLPAQIAITALQTGVT